MAAREPSSNHHYPTDGLPDTLRTRRNPMSPSPFLPGTALDVSPFAQSSGVTTRQAPIPSSLVPGGQPSPRGQQHLTRAATDGPPFRPPHSSGPFTEPVPQNFQRSATDFTATPHLAPSQPPQQSQSSVQKAYGEARHFLGGLINHPTESSKHFTILRHSHGIVFYRGPTTSVTISVFADASLPPDRSYWLQDKGFTGKTGMKAKALLHLHDDWFDVTPTMAVRPDQVDPNDERAWQRDISKFRKKAPSRVKNTHKLRETIIARIPAEAGDGYFSILLCHGHKKVLCTSPVFRVISTSADPSSIRGASLSTLPLELGAMALGTYAQTMTQTMLNPVTKVVQPYMPGFVAQTAAETVYAFKEDSIDEVDSQYARAQGSGEFDMQRGPVPPYPIDFRSRAELSHEAVRMPRLNLVKVPEATLHRLHGHYFGWARLEDVTTSGPSSWMRVVLSVLAVDASQLTRVNLSHAMKRVVTMRLLDDVKIPAQIKVQVRVMGFIRPDAPSPVAPDPTLPPAEAKMLVEANDASFAVNTLNHPAWGPESRPLNTGWMDRFGDMQMQRQKLLNRVPLDKVGIRKPGDELKDRQVTFNGFYITR